MGRTKGEEGDGKGENQIKPNQILEELDLATLFVEALAVEFNDSRSDHKLPVSPQASSVFLYSVLPAKSRGVIMLSPAPV